MKNTILLALTALMMVGCVSQTKYKVYYKVYYPNNTRSYCIIVDDEPYLDSSRGTNYLKVGSEWGHSIIRTSAPIEIVKVIKLNEK